MTLYSQRKGFSPALQEQFDLNGIASSLVTLKTVFASSNIKVFDAPAKVNAAIHEYDGMLKGEDFAQTDTFARVQAITHTGHLYLRRYEFEGVDADLDRAISLWQEANALSSEDSDGLDHVATGLLTRYERDGNTVDLDEAIRLSRAAQNSIPSSGVLLGLKLSMRSRLSGDVVEMVEAVRLAKQALKPFDLSIRPSPLEKKFKRQLNMLAAIVLVISYEVLRNADDLAVATQLLQSVTEDKNLDLEIRIPTEEYLVRCLLYRHGQTPSPEDLRSAAKLATSALELTREKDARLPRRLNLVGKCFHAQYLQIRTPCDLEQAIAYFQQAVDVSRTTSPYRSGYEQNLRVALAAR